jgi:hypothetical protein
MIEAEANDFECKETLDDVRQKWAGKEVSASALGNEFLFIPSQEINFTYGGAK